MTEQIAIFPIPNLVCFPGTVVPLHVFEPRYRDLIKESVQEGRLIGIPHTKNVISPAKPEQNREEILNSNQATYDPHAVYSAGRAVIEDVTSDGRFLVSVSILGRYETVDIIRELPYLMVEAKAYEDLDEEHPDIAMEYRKKIQDFFLAKAKEKAPKFHEILSSKEWNDISNEEFSFKIFQWIKMDGDKMQAILEMRSPSARLKSAWTHIEAQFQ